MAKRRYYLVKQCSTVRYRMMYAQTRVKMLRARDSKKENLVPWGVCTLGGSTPGRERPKGKDPWGENYHLGG